MTAVDQIAALVARLAPRPVCDDCIADRLELRVRRNASRGTRELAGRDGFERARAPCSLCGTDKLVIRRL